MAKKSASKKATATKPKAKKSAAKRPKEARRDLIVVDSPHVGSPPREGEVLSVIHGEVSVNYRVRWADGHETLITPSAGTVTIVRA